YVDTDKPIARGHLGLLADMFESVEDGRRESTRSAPVQFRKIEIKELPATEPAWTQLFNGRDHTGWHPVGGGREFRSTIANGVLKLPGVTYLISDAVYENYELDVDYRYAKANAGGEFAVFPMIEGAPAPLAKTQIARIYEDGHGELYSEFGA